MTLALEVLNHAEAFCGLPGREARALARRVLYTEGLKSLLRGAPEDLLARVALTKCEALEIELMGLVKSGSLGSAS